MENYFTIGVISKLSNIPTETLRYYDKVNLFCPDYRDEETGYRYYTKDKLKALLIIRRFRNLGFSIENMKNALEDISLDKVKSLIKDQADEYKKTIEILEAKKAACDLAYKRIERGIEIANEAKKKKNDSRKVFKIEKISPNHLLFSRKIMKNYVNSDISLARWIDVYEKCTENGIEMLSSIIVTYHSDPLDQFLAKDCDVEFGLIVNSDDRSKVKNKDIRNWGGFSACTSYYIGDYSNIINRHIEMLRWINVNSYKVIGPISEEFIISPLDCYNVDEHVTKIIIPVEKIG